MHMVQLFRLIIVVFNMYVQAATSVCMRGNFTEFTMHTLKCYVFSDQTTSFK